MEPTLRLATIHDLPAIVRIYNQAVELQQSADLEPVSVDGRRAWFAAHPPERRPLWVAEVAGEVAGWCSLSDYRPGRAAVAHTAEVSYYVDAAHRRRGLGRALLSHALAAAPALGVTVLFAIVLEDNAASLGLLKQHAFQAWGHLPGVARFGERLVGHRYLGRDLRATPPCPGGSSA